MLIVIDWNESSDQSNLCSKFDFNMQNLSKYFDIFGLIDGKINHAPPCPVILTAFLLCFYLYRKKSTRSEISQGAE